MNDSSDKNQISLASFFTKHMAAIVIKLSISDTSKETFITSFVISVQSRWFLISAAYCFREINNLTEKRYQIDSVNLVDFLHQDAEDMHPIPLSLQNYRPILIDKYDEEMDLGFIPLSPYYAELLSRNNVQALDETTWKDIPKEVDACWLFGLPAELQSLDQDKNLFRPMGLHVFLDADKPRNFKPRKHPRVYGRVELDGVINSIKGMSGGPLFVYYDSRYWVVAAQSSWYPDSQFIEAIPIFLLGKAIKEYYLDN